MMSLWKRLRSFFRKKPKRGTWANIGSARYQKTMVSLSLGVVSKIRRKAWGDDRYLYVNPPNTHIYGDMTDGHWPDPDLCPPCGPVRHVIKSAQWGKGYWQFPDEDVQADDWQVWEFGKWRDQG
jgi:hypothetical protein